MTAANTPIDHAAIRERYAIERDKRLRPDGADQYLEPSADLPLSPTTRGSKTSSATP